MQKYLQYWMKKLLNVASKSKKCERIPDSITDSMDMNLSKLQEIVKDRRLTHCSNPWGHKELDMI